MKLPMFCSMARNVKRATAAHVFTRSAPCSFTPIIMVPGSPAAAAPPTLPTCNISFYLSHGRCALQEVQEHLMRSRACMHAARVTALAVLCLLSAYMHTHGGTGLRASVRALPALRKKSLCGNIP